MLAAAIQAEILRLAYADHWSVTRIAHHVGVNWKSVRKVVQRRSVALVRARPHPRATLLTPFLDQLQALLARDPERSAVNCLPALRAAGYRGGITTLRMALARMRPTPAAEAFLALTFGPGERVQVDWGEFGDVFGIGRPVHAFLLVCCYSRWLTVEFTFNQTLEAFVRCHEHAFAFLGGYSREAQYDNLATAVAERRGRLVRWNPRFLAYAGHCGFRPVACTPGRGNEKGRVEDSVKYLRANFWPGRTFRDLADLNAQAQAWRDDVANQREHRVTRKVPGLHVAEERPHFLPLRESYDTDEVRSVVVPPTFRVAFDRNRYSVPWRLVGKALTLRADAETVTLWYGTHRVARHARDWGRDHDLVIPAHADGLLAQKPGAQGAWQVQAVEALGPSARQYLALIRAGTRSLRAELEHLLLLTTLYGPAPVEAALGACLTQAIVGSDHVARWLQLQHAGPLAPPPLTLGDPRLTVPPVRPNLARFDALLVDPDRETGPLEEPDAPADA
jgi:transposase